MRIRVLATHNLPDGTIGVIAIPAPRRRPRYMRGWTRIDNERGKLGAVWEREDGRLRLVHQSHPTALWPWVLEDAKGRSITSRKFSRLREAIEWIAKERPR